MVLMYTWRRGSRILFEKTRKTEVPLEIAGQHRWRRSRRMRVPGTAVFLTSDPEFAPTALMHSLKHYKVLHENNVILTIETAPTPRVDPAERVQHRADRRDLLPRGAALRLHGDAERAEGAGDRAPARLAVRHHVDVVLPVAAGAASRPRIPACRAGRTGCSSCSRASANDATDYFQIPTGRVVEVGTQVTV